MSKITKHSDLSETFSKNFIFDDVQRIQEQPFKEDPSVSQLKWQSSDEIKLYIIFYNFLLLYTVLKSFTSFSWVFLQTFNFFGNFINFFCKKFPKY